MIKIDWKILMERACLMWNAVNIFPLAIRVESAESSTTRIFATPSLLNFPITPNLAEHRQDIFSFVLILLECTDTPCFRSYWFYRNTLTVSISVRAEPVEVWTDAPDCKWFSQSWFFLRTVFQSLPFDKLPSTGSGRGRANGLKNEPLTSVLR
jgi:hypothetical protein